MLGAEPELHGDVVEAVAVDEPAGRHAVGHGAEVERAGVAQTQPQQPRSRQRLDVVVPELAPCVDVHRRVHERVGPCRQYGPPSLEVPRRSLLAGHADDVDVVVHDGGARLEARQRVGGDLVGCRAAHSDSWPSW